jgi:hypothetical protein
MALSAVGRNKALLSQCCLCAITHATACHTGQIAPVKCRREVRGPVAIHGVSLATAASYPAPDIGLGLLRRRGRGGGGGGGCDRCLEAGAFD